MPDARQIYERTVYVYSFAKDIDSFVLSLFVVSALQNPGHFGRFVMRVLTHLVFASPVLMSARRPMASLVVLWVLVNGYCIRSDIVNYGTKPLWSAQRLVVDFIGLNYAPRLWQVLLVEVVIAALQLILLVLMHTLPIVLAHAALRLPPNTVRAQRIWEILRVNQLVTSVRDPDSNAHNEANVQWCLDILGMH